jgi:hypothetical protein
MSVLDHSSLMQTVDNVNEIMLYGGSLTPLDGLEVARWIAEQQGGKNAYRGMFAPTTSDMQQGIHLFTGESLTSASARHCLGQEAARVAWLFGSGDPDVQAAYQRATGWMQHQETFSQEGVFCCGRCTAAYWHNFWTADFEDKEKQLIKGLKVLNHERDGSAKWRRFPFYFTIYVLKDIKLPQAVAELDYARPAMERYLMNSRPGIYTPRRRAVIEQALAVVG